VGKPASRTGSGGRSSARITLFFTFPSAGTSPNERSAKLPGPPARILKLGKPGWRPRSASAFGPACLLLGPGHIHGRDVLRPALPACRALGQMRPLDGRFEGARVPHRRRPPASRGDPDLNRVLLALGLRAIDVQIDGLPDLHRLPLLPVRDLEPRVV